MDIQEKLYSLEQEIQKQGYETICFWLPAFNTGGGTYYFCELAKYLRAHTHFDVYYMDFKDGYPSRLLENTEVKILEYNEEEVEFPLHDKCIVVTNSTRAIQLTKMRPDNKLLFWHYETVPCSWDSVFIMNEGSAFLELCRQKKAMMFHDWSSWDILSQDCGKEYEKKYLALFLPEKRIRADTALINENELNIAWLGRLAPEKIYSLFNLIDNIDLFDTNKKKNIHIIGDGRSRDLVEKYIKKYSTKMNFTLTGIIPKDKLDEYLINHVDIVFGMGLSALEGAALAIPSVIVKLDIKPFSGNEFIWLYDSKEYCVGILPSQRERFDVNYSNISDILDPLFLFNNKKQYANKCYEYYLKYHASIEQAVVAFLKALIDSEMTMADLEACIKYIPYNHVQVTKKYLFRKLIAQNITINTTTEKKA